MIIVWIPQWQAPPQRTMGLELKKPSLLHTAHIRILPVFPTGADLSYSSPFLWAFPYWMLADVCQYLLSVAHSEAALARMLLDTNKFSSAQTIGFYICLTKTSGCLKTWSIRWVTTSARDKTWPQGKTSRSSGDCILEPDKAQIWISSGERTNFWETR